MSTAIRDRFEIEMPVLKLFQAPTIGELAVLVDQARSPEPTVVSGFSRTSADPVVYGVSRTSAEPG